jgi:putative inorganic carbon (hco3(-)) transporter
MRDAVLRRRPPLGLAALLALGLALVLAYAARYGLTEAASLGFLLAVLLAVFAAGYLVWCAEPRYTFTLAIMAAPFAGHWQELGIPGQLAPERLLLIGGVLTVLLRGPGIRDRPRLRFEPVHWVMALTVLYACGSALFSGTLFQKEYGLELVEIFGILPFLVFTMGPVVFPTARERSTLLKGLVVLGAYLSLTTLFEMVGPQSLVFPSYILNPEVGIHFGRGRGPFADAVANGFGLYACALACAMAVWFWRSRPWRIFAGAVAVLCLVGTLLTLERSIWISTVAATLVAMLAAPATRRRVLPVLLVGALAIGAALVLVPGLSSKVEARASEQNSVWDRENLDRIAENMIDTRPLFGFGWGRYLESNGPYIQQAATYPLTATTDTISSYVLSYAVELGLVGVALWILMTLMGVGGAILTRGPPDIQPWRLTLLALFVFFAIVQSLVPPTVFPNLCLWLWAGVVWAGRHQAAGGDLAAERKSVLGHDPAAERESAFGRYPATARALP